MKKILLSTIFLYYVAANAKAQDLKTKLETAFHAFSNAVSLRDTKKFKSTISAHAYMEMKNQMLAVGAKFPNDFFDSPWLDRTSASKLTFKKAVANGFVAFCIYSCNSKTQRPSILILKFLQEDNVWKFDHMKEINTNKIEVAIKSGNFNFLETEKEFQPDGMLPLVPVEIVQDDYIAQLDIFGFAYEVQVTINGHVQSMKKDNISSLSKPLMGGVKKGKNIIVIMVKPINEKEANTLWIDIRTLIDKEEHIVFSLKQEKVLAGTITQEFIVP